MLSQMKSFMDEPLELSRTLSTATMTFDAIDCYPVNVPFSKQKCVLNILKRKKKFYLKSCFCKMIDV